jgi:hypothetical protein
VAKRLTAVVFSGLLLAGCGQGFSDSDWDNLFQWCTDHAAADNSYGLTVDCGAKVDFVQRTVDATTPAGDLRYDEECIVRDAKTNMQKGQDLPWSITGWSCGPSEPSWIRQIPEVFSGDALRVEHSSLPSWFRDILNSAGFRVFFVPIAVLALILDSRENKRTED